MKPSIALVVVAASGIAAMGCASKADSPATLHIKGTIAQRSSPVTGARAVAIGSDGRSFSALLATNGSFALDVPVGNTYRLVIANPTRTGELRVIGHLVDATTHGRTDVIAVKDAGTLALGTLRPAGSSPTTTAATAAGALRTMSVEAEDRAEHEDGEESDDDRSEGEESDDEDKLCDDGDDVELEAEHEPGPQHEASTGSAAPKSAAKSCDVHDTDHDGDDD